MKTTSKNTGRLSTRASRSRLPRRRAESDLTSNRDMPNSLVPPTTTTLRFTVVPKCVSRNRKRLHFSALITPIVTSTSEGETIPVREIPALWRWPDWIGLPFGAFPRIQDGSTLEVRIGQPGKLVPVTDFRVEDWSSTLQKPY